MSVYLRSNLNKNPWNEGKGKISSERAMFRIFCRKLMQGRLEVLSDQITLEVMVDVPTDELTKYVSNLYTP